MLKNHHIVTAFLLLGAATKSHAGFSTADGEVIPITPSAKNYKNVQFNAPELQTADDRKATLVHSTIPGDEKGTYIYYKLDLPEKMPVTDPMILELTVKNEGHHGCVGIILFGKYIELLQILR